MLQLHSHRPSMLHRDLKSCQLLIDRYWRGKARPACPAPCCKPCMPPETLLGCSPWPGQARDAALQAAGLLGPGSMRCACTPAAQAGLHRPSPARLTLCLAADYGLLSGTADRGAAYVQRHCRHRLLCTGGPGVQHLQQGCRRLLVSAASALPAVHRCMPPDAAAWGWQATSPSWPCGVGQAQAQAQAQTLPCTRCCCCSASGAHPLHGCSLMRTGCSAGLALSCTSC